MAKLAPQTFATKVENEIIFRSYEKGDEKQVNQFMLQIAKETQNTLKYEGMPVFSDEKLQKRWEEVDQHPVDLEIAAFDHGQLIGNLRFYHYRNHPWVKHIAIFGMAVRKDHWGEGIGSKLISLMFEHAKLCGIQRIEAMVRCSNDAGIALYKKHGFKIEGTREKAAIIDGIPEDEYFIARIITP